MAINKANVYTGYCAVTGIAVCVESVVRRKNTETQTRKSVFERWENVDGTFELNHADSLTGKHILLWTMY